MSEAAGRQAVREALSAWRREQESSAAPSLPPPVGEDEELALSPEEAGDWLMARLREGGKYFASELDLGERLDKARRLAAEKRRELPEDVDPHELSQAGWGVIFTSQSKRDTEHLLEPLLKLRKEQAGGRYKEFILACKETAAVFLKDCGETLGTIDPEDVPYYLLLVGNPQEIPFEFQYHLSLNHAVGRLDFSTPQELRDYVEHVREVETGNTHLGRRAVFFSVKKNEEDLAGEILSQYLVAPLSQKLTGYLPGWKVETWERDKATKANLSRLWHQEPPGLFIASCHGRRLPPGHTDQKERQGALMCQPSGSEDDLFTAADLQEVNLRGQIAMLFGCYSAGAPVFDNYPHEGKEPQKTATGEFQPAVVAPKPFTARLPQEMLRRGTLAVLGHVDRGWTLSFKWGEGLETTRSLESAVKRLLKGQRLGHALRPMLRRHAFLAAGLASLLDKERIGVEPNARRLGIAWTAVNDARNFVVLGDPAVYLLGRRGEASRSFQLHPKLWKPLSERAALAGESVEDWINKRIADLVRAEDDI